VAIVNDDRTNECLSPPPASIDKCPFQANFPPRRKAAKRREGRGKEIEAGRSSPKVISATSPVEYCSLDQAKDKLTTPRATHGDGAFQAGALSRTLDHCCIRSSDSQPHGWCALNNAIGASGHRLRSGRTYIYNASWPSLGDAAHKKKVHCYVSWRAVGTGLLAWTCGNLCGVG
jgi:hypothetical protein